MSKKQRRYCNCCGVEISGVRMGDTADDWFGRLCFRCRRPETDDAAHKRAAWEREQRKIHGSADSWYFGERETS